MDLACHAADELIMLVGAGGFQADTTLQKAKRDLDALRYADGIYDSLYRAAGRFLLAASTHYPGSELPTNHVNDQVIGTEEHHDDLRADHAS